MITLEDNSLCFSFPEIPEKLGDLLDQHVRDILPKFTLPANRSELVDGFLDEINSHRMLAGRAQTDALDSAAQSLTVRDVEVALRESVEYRIHDSLADLSLTFQRTLRIPDDGKVYPLPAGLGQFPLRSVDDFDGTLPEGWSTRGGVMMPMHQSEALWIDFSSSYPFALKIAAGKINAVSGEPWSPHLRRDPQNYVVIPEQPWLDGFSVGEGVIRQFVALPLGSGYSVEEQLTGKAEFGGIQLQAYPMRAESWFRDEIVPDIPSSLRKLLPELFKAHLSERIVCAPAPERFEVPESMGLGAGGTVRQEIYEDPHEFADWDQSLTSRCFVHLCNSMLWRQITGANPPHPPLTAREYKESGIPWFDYYRDDLMPLKGSKKLAGVKSVVEIGKENKSQPLPENESIAPETIIQYGNARRPREIREFLDAT